MSPQTGDRELIAYLREVHAMSSGEYRQLIEACLRHDITRIQRWLYADGGTMRVVVPCLSVLGYEDKTTRLQETILISIFISFATMVLMTSCNSHSASSKDCSIFTICLCEADRWFYSYITLVDVVILISPGNSSCSAPLNSYL
jgi:hypothetical protein